jgi:AcrR family transcriptional regulator
VEASRRPGQRAGITRELVIAAGRELLIEHGAAGLTMRAVARHLAVAPGALYSHVRTKAELIDEVLDDLLSQVDAPDPLGTDWRGGLYGLMTSTHEVLLEHPGLVPLYVARRGARGPNAQRLGEIMLALLATQGITGTPAREALRALLVYTIGSAAFTAQTPIDPELDDAQLPSPAELETNFENGLRWLLAGIASA